MNYLDISDWIKKNLFTTIGIIIILLLVLYDYSQIQSQKVDVAKQCNKFWEEQVSRVCPAALTGMEYQPMNLSRIEWNRTN